MLVVNLAESMHRLLDHVRSGASSRVLIEQLESDVVDELRARERDISDGYDLVVSTLGGRISGVYEVVRNGTDSGHLSLLPAAPFAGVIGKPLPKSITVPLGKRSTIGIDLNEFLSGFGSRDVNFSSCDGHEVETRMAEFVREQAAVGGSGPSRSPSAAKDLFEQVGLSLGHDGSLRVTVPAGIEVQIIHRDPVEGRTA